ncbi:RING-H2 finger protein ATL46-like [Primulina huaijiensis]|uniref:RING-H2 finger protein ATL46-like n=1 Tax=Primulina huaijiensis TaxID=1492673 RepID=UPI003CC784F7
MSWIQSAFGSKVSPIILFIIVVLAVVFFILALLHLLVKFLLKQRSSNLTNYPEISTSGAFQRQLQHLFHLHDSGLDQAYIDLLPVFLYKDIMGLKEHFDCAVCLCEFSEQDKLRLLPSCSHAFHLDCIDTWLLSNSTCPLCRGVILTPGYAFENPMFYCDDSKEIECGSSRYASLVGVPSLLKDKEDDTNAAISEKRVFSVRLGKLKSAISDNRIKESEVGETSNSNLDGRRCFSMGSFQYVVADSELQVALSQREHGAEGSSDVRLVKWRVGHSGNFTAHGDATATGGGKKITCGTKGESFSVSKIWQWSKKSNKFPSSTTTHDSISINM